MLIVITAFSWILAATMGIVAWRFAREERRRSDARVAALASDLGDLELRPAAVTAPAGEIFHLQAPGRSPSRLAVIVPVGAFAVATALALVVVTSRAGHAVSGPRVSEPAVLTGSAPKADHPRSAMESQPLELIALGHEREGDRIVVRGIVRNPTAGTEQDRVAAVVFLFNRDGGFLGSGRASVDVPALAPGSESPFVVTIPNASEVGRYRVSFRSGENVVPHVDRRQHS